MVLRFANTIFERLWGSRNVSHVQITVAEKEGVGTRAGYYDHSGAMRDMVQNHMLQVLTMLAMEPPVSLEADAIRESKLNVLRALRPISLNDAARLTVRARYSAGTLEGKAAAGYLHEKGVAPDSKTETYRRAEDLRRQLAMVRGAILSAPRQTPAQARDRDRRAVPSSRPRFSSIAAPICRPTF